MNQDLEASTKQLADGFSALCEEYKLLAQQYSVLENKLSAATSECESLRCLLPPSTEPPAARTDEKSGDVVLLSGRNLDEWLAQMYEKSGSRDKESLIVIRDAEFACFKVRNKLGGERRFGPRSGRASPVEPRLQPRRSSLQRSRQLSPIPMEQDFTVEGKQPGELGCPFAGMVGGKPAGRAASITQSNNIPTPRGSGSHLGFSGRHSKRASFADPIIPQVKPDDVLSPTPSVVSGGPACPIRFLGQHSPEEVAKYFEEHKHELPRSHEVCVKRFQANADSIRELDAKYGNLVTMIQGLGQKHQPMLPEVPNPDTIAAASDEQRSLRRVEKWAKAVSECAPADATEDNRDADPNQSAIVDDGEDDERLPHFDRNLKDIRVGESPSRPWGVTIPSRLLDREGESAVSSAPAAAIAHKDTPTNRETDETSSCPDPGYHDAGTLSKNTSIGVRAKSKGKCPFDHMAMQASPSSKSFKPSSGPPPRRLSFTNVRRETASKHIAVEVDADAAAELKPQQPKAPRIINHGVAIIANAGHLGRADFENRGTLVLGYKDEEAKGILAALER